MSRIGRLPILVPPGVTVTMEPTPQGTRVQVTGPRGSLVWTLHPIIAAHRENGAVTLTPASDAPNHRALHGLSRALLANMVQGVTEGFQKTLELQGVGYRAQQSGKGISLSVGFSHPVEVPAPEGISFQLEGQTRIHVLGIDKQRVGEVSAQIRAVQPPNVYSGKGVRYLGERVRRKAGKAGTTRKQ